MENQLREFFESIKKEDGYIPELYDIPNYIKDIKSYLGDNVYEEIALEYRAVPWNPKFMEKK